MMRHRPHAPPAGRKCRLRLLCLHKALRQPQVRMHARQAGGGLMPATSPCRGTTCWRHQMASRSRPSPACDGPTSTGVLRLHVRPTRNGHACPPPAPGCMHSFRELVQPRGPAAQHADDDGPSCSGRAPGIAVGDMLVHETGPLAGFAHVLDTGAWACQPLLTCSGCRHAATPVLRIACPQPPAAFCPDTC